ncbi:MAG: hypothetical protein ACI9MJ_002542, partial [Alphaproteobacteria bacterium]
MLMVSQHGTQFNNGFTFDVRSLNRFLSVGPGRVDVTR